MWPVGLGLIPLGLAFGVLIVQSGFSWWWAPIFSFVIYAGSVEYLAISMVTSGMGPLTAMFTGGMINFRHIFYGITFPRHKIRSFLARLYVTYALTDETYAVVSAKRVTSGPVIVAIAAWCQAMWVIPGILGAVLGQALPDGLQGMEFALVALFVVLAFESFEASQSRFLVCVALVCAFVSFALFPGNLLVAALTVYFIILLVRWRLLNAS
ncbi:MAG: AzlC family ABC transporter permease [Corynebacterium glucuronolyticum]|nr:AzlC family ABC transporter permease [Mycobacteriaceae bacterium]MDY5833999.1 AzlC family ABC transporter permease [Corynebacterium glucuronolyticum]